MERIKRVIDFTIPNGEAESGPVPVDDVAFGVLETPAALTGSTYTIQARSSKAGTWKNVADSEGADVSMTVAANKIIRIPDAAMAATEIRFVSNLPEAGERSLKAVLKS